MKVAACTAASYESINKHELRKFLIFNSDAELDQFIAHRQNWRVVNDRVLFQRDEVPNDVTRVAPAIMTNTVNYARSLERIV